MDARASAIWSCVPLYMCKQIGSHELREATMSLSKSDTVAVREPSTLHAGLAADLNAVLLVSKRLLDGAVLVLPFRI